MYTDEYLKFDYTQKWLQCHYGYLNCFHSRQAVIPSYCSTYVCVVLLFLLLLLFFLLIFCSFAIQAPVKHAIRNIT